MERTNIKHTHTPKQVLVLPAIKGAKNFFRCSGVANVAIGCVAYTLACIDCAPASPAPLLHDLEFEESTRIHVR